MSAQAPRARTIIGGLGLSATRTVYAPWLQVGGDPDLVRGEDVEELVSTFASDLLTGMFLRLTVTAPDGVILAEQRGGRGHPTRHPPWSWGCGRACPSATLRQA